MRPEHLSVDVEPLEPTVDRLRNAGSLFVGPWSPESAGDYATGANHVLPTGGLARASGGLSVESYGKYTQVQRVTRRGTRRHPTDCDRPRRGRGPPGPPRRHRVALQRFGVRPMSPTPVTYTNPGDPIAYSWEATNEEVAERYGVPIESIVRFDLNTSPAPPELVARLIALGRFDVPMSEYPPADYRRLIAAAAARYGVATTELSWAPAPTRSSTSSRRRSCRSAARPSSRRRPTRCIASTPNSAARPSCAVPRRRDADWTLDLDATREAAARGRRRVAVQPEQPDGHARARRRHRRRCSSGSWPTPSPTAAPPRSSSSTRRTPSSPAGPWSGCEPTTRTSSSSGPPARPTPSPGCGSASRSPIPRSSPG